VLQDLGLAPAEQRLGAAVEQRGAEHAVDVGKARVDGADRADEILGRAALDDEAPGAGVQRRLQDVGLGGAGVEDDRGRIRPRGDLAAERDAVDRGHADVRDHDVGAPALGKLEQLAAVAGLSDDAQVVLCIEQSCEP
jgi:hypothetical protein